MTGRRRLLWFCVAGVVGLAVDVATLTATREWLGVYLARLLSFVVAATATWLINRRFAFDGRQASHGLGGEYLRYLGLMAGGGLVNFATYSLLAWKLDQRPMWLAAYVAAGSLAGLSVNYLGASTWLYRPRRPD